METEKSKSPTLLLNTSRSCTNYKKPKVEIPPGDIDQSQYQDFFYWTQPGPPTTFNQPNLGSHTKNFNKFNFYSLRPGNSSVAENAVSDKDPVVSDYFHISSGKIGQLPREWWKNDSSNDM
jgi:hypothetical protein